MSLANIGNLTVKCGGCQGVGLEFGRNQNGEQTLTVQTDDGIVGSIFGLTEIDRKKDRGKVLTPEIDREIDRGKVLTPRKDCKIDRDKVLGTDLRFLEKSR